MNYNDTNPDYLASERLYSNTSMTGHKKFDDSGYLVLKNVINAENFYSEIPTVKGQYTYADSTEHYMHKETEKQVPGSIARYHYPPYKKYVYVIKKVIEESIGRKLYETYFYDRFYNPGQELKIHTDRPACEISMSIHIGTNLDEPWPFWIKTPDVYDDPLKKTKIIRKGKNKKIVLKPGDGLIYKGCERPHWREVLHGDPLDNNLYYHQIFFHYVLKDGIRAHHAFDRN